MSQITFFAFVFLAHCWAKGFHLTPFNVRRYQCFWLYSFAIGTQTKHAVNFISYRYNLITLVAHVPLSVLFAGRRRCWPSRKTKSYHRFPDPHHTCVACTRREGWAGYRGVPPSHPHPGRLCHPTQESQLRILNHDHSANKKTHPVLTGIFSVCGESTLHGSRQLLYLATKKSRTGLFFFPVSSQFVLMWASSCSH